MVGGNIGTLLAAELALENDVRLYTRYNTDNRVIEVFDQEGSIICESKLSVITNDINEALEDADIVFCTLPSNAVPSIIKEIGEAIPEKAILFFMPGTGGKEYISKALIKKDITIAGLQRVYSIARLKEKGKSVYMLGKKKKLYISTIPKSEEKKAISILEKLLKIPCNSVDNYLAVTLTPSNPILHTTRIYSILNKKKKLSKEVLFYEDWDANSARILFKCDNELQNICNSLKMLNLKEVVSLKEYYESETEEQFIKKMKSIKSFKGIKMPLIKEGKYYCPDYDSRYFTEDFPYGLLIIKGFAEICNVNTPNIDKIIEWFQNIQNKDYLIDGKLKGRNLVETGIPQNYGINNIEDIYRFYGHNN